MESNKQQNHISSKPNCNTMEPQATARCSQMEKENFRSSNSAANDENDVLRMGRERSRQNIMSAEANSRKGRDGSLSDATLEAIQNILQKCMDHTLRAYFIHTMEKVECLSGQLLRTECAVAKMHLDLVERICKLCNQNVMQYQCLSERLDNKSGNEFLDGRCQHDFHCNCESDSECLPTETPQTAANSYPMAIDEQTTEEPEKPPSEKEHYSDNETFNDSEEKIRKLNLELRFTRDELEECLQRLKEINEIERAASSNPKPTSTESYKSKARSLQEQPEKKNGSNSTSDSTKLTNHDEDVAQKQDIPQPPPQPASQRTSLCQQKLERKSDCDSEHTNAFSRRQSGNNSERKSLPKNFERAQNYAGTRVEKKRNRKS